MNGNQSNIPATTYGNKEGDIDNYSVFASSELNLFNFLNFKVCLLDSLLPFTLSPTWFIEDIQN